MKTILCYGDSNTYGQNPEFSVDQTKPFRHSYTSRWTGILQNLLQEQYHVVEEGLSGRTTILDNPVELHRNGLKTLPACIMSHSPVDLLIIMLGSNDLRGCFKPIPFSVINGMDAFLLECLNPAWQIAGGEMKVLLVSPPYIKQQGEKSPWPGLFEDVDAVPLSQKMAGYYKSLADKYGINFINAADFVEASALDFVHMNAENHKKLAYALKDKVIDILST